ncbi:NarL family two-component system sensor histidine kinase LiaS [Virgibacillus natechei]|uniref:Sensor histidine kinase n=1 Tax=Virgibacillus natechei TaxID=1216297 RepID=A0ABS4IF09_9BACI|nr:sensor histidine kinase [Virgibacillus natechei]MBP1969480.1 NarL family two-component system sensor histidine kinase LiaS [Virgibacillus natechei]UZD11815.1 sensor histidine kinase [Virgibacillus natechei]
MTTIIRHVFTAILVSLFIALMLVGVTLLAFPLDDWSLIFKQEIGNVSFLLIVIGIPIMAGTILGMSTGWYWKQRLQQIDRKLDEMVKGQKVTVDDESYKELDSIEQQIGQLQEKMRKQAEYSQRLATERANEREQSLQEVVVQERNRLARELHDSVSQQLFAASMMMSAINESNPPENESIKKQMQMVENMIHQSQLEMRALLLHLRPVALKGKSLQIGVEELLVEMTQKVPMEIDWKVEEFTVDKGVEDQLFRILQESMSNTLRHAEAITFHVMLIERDETVILRTVDNGKGFDMENIRTGSYGLQNMRERAYEVGGIFKIISVPNEGTQLEVKVPNLRKEVEHND